MNHKKKEIILSILGIVSLILITVGVSYSFFNYAKEGTKENSIETGTITFLYTEVSKVGKGISIQDAYPISDEIGKVQIGEGKVFDFKVTSTTPNSSSISYEVTARKKSNSTLEEDVVKVYLTRLNGELEEEVLLEKYSNLKQTEKVDSGKYIEKTIYQGRVPKDNSNYEENFRLRMWIDEETDFSPIKGESGEDIYPYNGKEFTITVNVYANGKVVTEEDSLYIERTLNGTDPVLSSNLIPITIDNDGTVRKADTSKEWYSYEKKNWANAVVLKDRSIIYTNDEIIPEDNIESYFVWIPRYKYKLFDTTGPQAIDIIFEDKNTSPSNGSNKGEYLTHPAFQAFDSNGLWVGKFETGYVGATSTVTAQVNSSDSSMIVIKPNVYSWRGISVGNAFKASYNYLRSEESHMMKNTEWGAMAYLTHSDYGRCTNGICSEVRINNNANYITGYASIKGTEENGYTTEGTNPKVDGTNTINYLNSNSVLASTTGNRSGIYDMSGGAWEYVMGYTTGASTIGGNSGITTIHPDFFTNSNWNKYYDKYSSTVSTEYSNRILGDATGELGPFSNNKSNWYQDYGYFVTSSTPWFARGGAGYSNSNAGSFAFSYDTGGMTSVLSFRVLLAPSEQS